MWERSNTQAEEEETRPRMTAAKTRAGPAQARGPRRNDLSYVGRALPRSKGTFPFEPAVCQHQSHMQARGGRSGNDKIFWLACKGCGSRWERTNAAKSTNGVGRAGSATSSTGPITPAVSAGTVKTEDDLRAEKWTELFATEFHDIGVGETSRDDQDLEMIPQL